MTNPLLTVLCVLAVFTAAAAQDAAAPAANPDTYVGDASYGMGYNLAKDMLRSPMKLDAEKVMAGMRDAIDAKESAVPEPVFQAAMTKLRTEAQAAAQAELVAQAAKNAAAGDAFRAENAKKPGVTTTASGLQIETIQEGTGPVPAAADSVKVHYTGKLLDGTTFDSSVDRGEPVVFPLDAVIKGWSEGVALMKVGGKSRLVISPDLAYGPEGTGPIPPQATLVFDVELIEIMPAVDAK